MKQKLTELVAEKSAETAEQLFPIIWMNPRKGGGLRLTEIGLHEFQHKLDLEAFHANVKQRKNIESNFKTLLALDKKINCPYYIYRKRIIFFDRAIFNWFALCGFDIQRFLITQQR
jgi:hypothetical protein